MARVHQSPSISAQVAPGAATVKTPALRHWRTVRALRQIELAERADVSVISINRGERGDSLQLMTVRKLAEALDVTPAELQREPPV